MSIKNRAVAVACGLALATTALAPAAALADNTTLVKDGNTGTTEVTIEAQKDAQGHDQLAFEVPTVISFAAKADGTLVGPSAEATKIVNKSVFPIHVTNMSVSTDNTSWNLVDDASKSSEANALSFEIHGLSAALVAQKCADLDGDTYWNMGYAGSVTDSVAIDSTGKVANVNLDLSQPQHAATVTWTLAAGAAE